MLTCWQRKRDEWHIEWGAEVQLLKTVLCVVADHASLRIR